MMTVSGVVACVVVRGSNGDFIRSSLLSSAVIFRVYCADHTYCTLRFAVTSTAENIKTLAADKLQLNRAPDDLCLVEVRSNGERAVFKDTDVSIPTALSLNGRIFVSPKDHLDALVNRWEFFADAIPRIPFELCGILFIIIRLYSRRRRCQSRRWWSQRAWTWTWRRWARRSSHIT